MKTPFCKCLFGFAFVSLIAAAQNPLNCTMSAGVPAIVRVEGVAEEVSQVVIACTGGTPTAAGLPIPSVTIDATLNTNVTSRLLDAAAGRSEALLLLDEPQPAEQVEAPAVPFAGAVTGLGNGQYKGAGRPNVFGAQQNGAVSLRWANIPFDPPGNGVMRILRIVNVRANANYLGVGLFSPSQVTMAISASAPLGPAINGPLTPVAFIQSGISTSTTPATFQQCSPGSHSFPIVFTELLSTAFRHAAATGSQNVPATGYYTESMFFSNAFTGIGAGAGRASQGTQLRARFSNVPANVTITVPTSGSNAAGDAASLVAFGVSGSTADQSTGVVTLSGGSGSAIWEVTASNPNAVSALSFTATASYSASPQPGLGTASLIGDFAPPAVTLQASTEAAPRFLPGVQTVTPFTIAACTGAGTVSVSNGTLGFTATAGGSVISAGQDVTVSATSGVTSWIASSDSAWLSAVPNTGVPGGIFKASIVAPALPPAGVYTGRITVTAPGASNSPLTVTCTLTVTSAGTGGLKIVKVSGDGQLTSLFNGFTLPLVVRVEDGAGLPVAGKIITWTEQGGANFGSPNGTATDANGLAQMLAIPAGYFNPGTPFLVYSITATTDIGSVKFGMTSYPVTGSVFNPPPLISLIKPDQLNRTITAKVGSTTVDAIRALINSGGGNSTNPTPIPGVALNIGTGNTNPAASIVATCAGGTPLSGIDGIASCDLIVTGKVGTTPLLVDIGALNNFPGVQLNVIAGDPVAPVILQGNGQFGGPGSILPVTLMVRVADAYGNTLPSAAVTWTVVLPNSATLLNPSTQTDANGIASAQVQLGSVLGTVQVKVAAGGKESTFQFTNQNVSSPVTLAVSRSAMAFGASTNGASVTPPQPVSLTMTGASNNWTAASDSVWLGVSPASGLGSGKFTVSIVAAALPGAGTYTGKITVNAAGATNGPLVVNCTLTVKSAGTVPFGAFDTPSDNATGIAGNIAVTGWALDDIGVKSVTLWRDPVGPEPTHANGYVYIADALFVPGARPDVELAYPGSPQANRAGWGYLMLTNGLPSITGPKGNGIIKLHAIATDVEGNQVNLGAKTITVANASSIKPFGTLDTPAPGETISGTYLNYGWAVTPQPASIPLDGHTMWVGINGVNFAHPLYGYYRADLAAAFPGYANSLTCLGGYYLDTTKYANGMYNLGWLVYDSAGNGDGIGSRFIQIQNPALPSGDPIAAAADEGLAAHVRAARITRPTAPAAGYPAYRSGYDLNAELTPIRQAGEGLLEPIELKELDRLEIHLASGQQWTAALRVGDELRDLPIGSTFDAEGGIFYWQVGAVFGGEYRLEFQAAEGASVWVAVRVGARSILTAIQ